MVDIGGLVPNLSFPSMSFLSMAFFWKIFKLAAWVLIGWLIATIFLKYRFIILTRVQRGVGQKIKINLAKKVIEKDGIIKLKFLGSKKSIPFPQNDFVYPAMMGFEFIELYTDVGDSVHPVKFGFLEGENFLYPVEQDSKSWIIQGTKETMQIYNKQTWMNQYGHLLGLGLVACVLLITVILSYKQLDKMLEASNQAVQMGAQVLGSIKAPPIQ